MMNADEADKLYNLLKRVLRDIRDALNYFAKPKADYVELDKILEIIHDDYVGFFGRFLDDIRTSATPKGIAAAKRRFLTAKRRQSKFRILSKVEAHDYLHRVTDVAEIRYLVSVIWYLAYSADYAVGRLNSLDDLDCNICLALEEDLIGSGMWNSSAGYFWDEIEEIEDASALIELTKTMLDSILKKYSIMKITYDELPNRGLLKGKGPTQTRFSREVEELARQRALPHTTARK